MSDQSYDVGGFAANFARLIKEIIEWLAKIADNANGVPRQGWRLIRFKDWIIENYGLIILIAVAAVLLYFAWAYLRDNILTDSPKKDELRKWGYCRKCGVFFDGGFCVDCTQSDKPDPNKLV